jgi:uncharacterized protein YaiL (DUF2058 family)
MRYWPLFFLIALTSTNALAQPENQTFRQQADQAKFRQLQRDLDLVRIQAQTEKNRAESDRIQQSSERMRVESEKAHKEPELSLFFR